MADFAARIRRVRFKAGGADVRVIHNDRAEAGGEDYRGVILQHAKSIVNLATEEAPLAGFMVIGFYADGTTSSGFRLDRDLCPVPSAVWPAYAAEVVRRDVVTDQEARNVFDDMFQWVE